MNQYINYDRVLLPSLVANFGPIGSPISVDLPTAVDWVLNTFFDPAARPNRRGLESRMMDRALSTPVEYRRWLQLGSV